MSTARRMLLLAGALVGLPLIGVWSGGGALAPYLEFPPRTPPGSAPALSWAVFGLIAAVGLVALSPFLRRLLRPPHRAPSAGNARLPLPGWGRVAVCWLVLAWVLAWTRLEWFRPLQEFTFTPLWLGYIVVVNALTFSRRGRCLMLSHKRDFLWLFPVSAVFWWYFEFLNRFAGNWHYVGVSEWSPGQYTLICSLAFATVLPAVLSTAECLGTFPRLYRGLDGFARPKRAMGTAGACALLLSSMAALAALARWPSYFFAFVWLAPLGVVVALCRLGGRRVPFAETRRGDWRGVWLAALAGLVCGVFWELWNANSLAKWEYTVPFVHTGLVFEMPVLGYLGYLPFGLVCFAVVEFLGARFAALAEAGKPGAVPAAATR